MKKHFILFTLMIMTCVIISAQSTIKGKVVDASSRAPLAGASVIVEGRLLTNTASDGTFTIACTREITLTVSFVGYEPKKIKSACNGDLTVALNATGNTLDNVDITAMADKEQSLLHQPAAITRLSTKELKRGPGIFFDDAINTNVPGVTMNRRAVSSGQQFNIRGYGNGTRGTRGVSSNFDGQGYKVYLNGIPVTDGEGITVMDDIDFGSVENAEILKGPSGTLYGLAIAGVVNLRTIRPVKGETSIGQDILIGNYGLQRYTTHLSIGGEKSSVLINYGRQRSEGFTIHNNSDKDFINASIEVRPSEKQTVAGYFGYSDSYEERSGELTVAQFVNEDYSGNIEYIKRNAHSQVYTVRAGLGHSYKFNDHIRNSTSVFATGFNSNASSAGGWTDKSSVNMGFRSTFDTRWNLNSNATLSGITGIEAQRVNAQTVGYTMLKDPRDPNATWTYGNPYYWIIGASTSNLYAASTTKSLFTEWSLGLPKGLTITAGIGYSTMKIVLDDRFFVANKPTHFDTAYKGMLSPHFAINKVINSNVSVYAAYSRAYKAPVSAFFYIPYIASPANTSTGILNNQLKPEIGDQIEIGTKGEVLKRKLTYQLALFHTVFSDKMTTVAVPLNATTTAYSYVVNGGKQIHNGIEISLRYNLVDSRTGFFTFVTPFVNYTFADYEYRDFKFQTGTTTANIKTFDFSGSPVAGVSKHVFATGADIMTKPGIYGNLVFLYRDKMPITAPDTLYTTGYNILNARLGFKKRIHTHFEFDASFGIDNITGTKYPMMIFINQLPDAYVAAPRKANYFAGLKLRYIF